jgi:branched-subunit amino acid aminotransferase/4-amino-4-deoxychorismate lyase
VSAIFETMRVREGRIPLLDRHLARLEQSAAVLGLPKPSAIIREIALEHAAEGPTDHVLRLGWSRDGTAWADRELGRLVPQRLVTVAIPHVAYPLKSEERLPFDRALAEAERVGGTEPLLLTPAGMIAETARWAILWMEGEMLRYPAADLGVLPSIGLGRVLEIAAALGMLASAIRAPRRALEARPAWLVNAVRGLVPIEALDGQELPSSKALRAVARAFWPAA